MARGNGTSRNGALDDLDMNRVAAFVRIAEAKGVGAAAARAKMPKSSVSRALTQLEDELGVELLVRRSQSFQLTEAGQAFYEAASRGLAAVREAREALRPDGMVLRGSLRVAAPPGVAAFLVAPAIVEFGRRFPLVDIELCVTAAKVDPTRDGFDVVLRIGTLEDSPSKVRRIGAIDAAIFASRAYLAERGVPRRPSDLSKHECILQTRTPDRARWILRGPAGAADVAVCGRLSFDDQFSAMAAATAGGGLVVLPAHMVGHTPSMAPLQRVLPDYDIPGEPVQLVYAASRHVPRRVTLFCDAIFDAMRSSCPSASS